MDLAKLKYIAEDSVEQEIMATQYSDDFAGVYLHSGSPFVLKDHIHAIYCFRAYSEYIYPIYFFISDDAITEDFYILIGLYRYIRPMPIRTLKNVVEFNNFSINELLHWIDEKHNNLIYFQSDGWLIKRGYEELCSQYDYLGAKWKSPIRVIENTFNFPSLRVGNGGMNYRKRDKTLEILALVNKNGGQQSLVKGIEIDGRMANKGPFLAEDLFFSYFGFGAGIYKPVPLDVADQFSLEPITLEQYNQETKPCHAFHRIDE